MSLSQQPEIARGVTVLGNFISQMVEALHAGKAELAQRLIKEVARELEFLDHATRFYSHPAVAILEE